MINKNYNIEFFYKSYNQFDIIIVSKFVYIIFDYMNNPITTKWIISINSNNNIILESDDRFNINRINNEILDKLFNGDNLSGKIKINNKIYSWYDNSIFGKTLKIINNNISKNKYLKWRDLI